MIVFSDLHLSEDSAETCLSQVLPGIREAALERGDKAIAFLGDWWDVRYRVIVWLQNAVRDELRQWQEAGLLLRVLPGNHDQVDVAGRNALEVFDEMTSVFVYSDPTIDVDGVWIPYRKRVPDIVKAVADAEGKGRNSHGRRVLWTHHGMRGAWMNDNRRDEVGLPPETFGGFDVGLTGHYHRPHVVGRLIYVGSPYQTKVDEAGQPKGYGIWDGNEYAMVTTHWGPRYHVSRLERAGAIDLSGVSAGDEVRVELADGADAERLRQQLEEIGARYVLTPEVAKSEARLSVEVGAPLRDFAVGYAELERGDLDQDELMRAYDEIAGSLT